LSPSPLRRVLDAAIVAIAAVLLLIAALGGIDYDWGILRLRFHSIVRPLLLLSAALIVRAKISTLDASAAAARGLLALVLAAAAVYATYHVRVCGGLDSYGYISTSSLIASGRLTEPQPLVAYLPFESASSAVAPLGYVAGRDGHTEVPRFSLGLPLVMAVFRAFGPLGPFYVPLVMAYLAIALTFVIVRNNTGLRRQPAATFPHPTLFALFAAALVAVDPLMVDYAIQPMSDVPAMCWLLGAVALIVDRPSSIVDRPSSIVDRRSSIVHRMVSRHRAVLGGLCAGMAFLTRPALLPAALAIGVVTLDRPLKESVRYGATLLAFVLLQMALNVVLYGNARTSGYGPTSYMFEISAARLAANGANFAKWLTYSQTFLFWFLWPGALVVLRKRKWAWQISAVAAAAAAPYLFYLVFDDWESSRFVLPTIVLVLILTACALDEVVRRAAARAPAPLRAAIALAVLGCAFVSAAGSHRLLRTEGVYRLWELEQKYELAGRWIDAHLPARAVVFAGLDSGSVRYYGHRPSIRWDQVPSDKMSATLHNLRAAGYEPYLALDVASEPPLFENRFREDPAVRTEQIGRVRVVNFYRFVSAE
jgi:hypothetical protein